MLTGAKGDCTDRWARVNLDRPDSKARSVYRATGHNVTSRRCVAAQPALPSRHSQAQQRSIWIAAGQNAYLILEHLINEPMLIIDSFRPATGKFVFEWFRLSNSAEWIIFRFLSESQDAQGLLSIVLDPPSQIIYCGAIKFQVSHGRPRAKFPRFGLWPPADGPSSCGFSASMPSHALIRSRATIQSARSPDRLARRIMDILNACRVVHGKNPPDAILSRPFTRLPGSRKPVLCRSGQRRVYWQTPGATSRRRRAAGAVGRRSVRSARHG
jgi:hypothetical protein